MIEIQAFQGGAAHVRSAKNVISLDLKMFIPRIDKWMKERNPDSRLRIDCVHVRGFVQVARRKGKEEI